MSKETDTRNMTTEEAVQILREHNAWGHNRQRPLGIAIDTACDAITALQQQLAGSEQAVATQRNAICNVTAERDALLGIIKNYCKETNWILPSYKAPPHIKALFDAARGGHGE